MLLMEVMLRDMPFYLYMAYRRFATPSSGGTNFGNQRLRQKDEAQ